MRFLWGAGVLVMVADGLISRRFGISKPSRRVLTLFIWWKLVRH